MQDRGLFSSGMTQNGKSPGPDSIPNELLKHLPKGVHQAIHKMSILMWITGSTPKAWKESRTILLYKKGNEYELSKWRPIAQTQYTCSGQAWLQNALANMQTTMTS